MSAVASSADVIIVGAGPAGVAALLPLLAAGRRVIWVEQSARAGGQIWRASLPPAWQAALATALRNPLLSTCFGHTVFDARTEQGEHRLRLHRLAAPHSPALKLQAPQLLLCLGAREKFLPFPGWTLPGVTGAGGLQALVKQGWPVREQQVVIAGSGPLLLAAADTVRSHGGHLSLIAEQASRSSLLAFAARMSPSKLAQAAGLAWRLRGITYRQGVWVQQALGEHKLEAVRLSDGHTSWELACDALGVGFGLQANSELAQLLGCRLREDGAIAVDEQLRTSCPGIWAAGECTGIGGVDKSIAEGRLAAQTLLGQTPNMRPRRQALAFGAQLQRSFALRPELLKLADAHTLICRCEDVSFAALKAHSDWRDAKLQTRCGMGACQGRICGPITETLLGWPASQARGVRSPLLAYALASDVKGLKSAAAFRGPDPKHKTTKRKKRPEGRFFDFDLNRSEVVADASSRPAS